MVPQTALLSDLPTGWTDVVVAKQRSLIRGRTEDRIASALVYG